MIKAFDNYEIWWVTGAQLLYGGDAVVAVAFRKGRLRAQHVLTQFKHQFSKRTVENFFIFVIHGPKIGI